MVGQWLVVCGFIKTLTLCKYFGAKLAFIAGIFLKRYSLCMKIYFQFHFYGIWSTAASIFSITAWKAPTSSWSPSELVIFLKNHPWCFGLFGKLSDIKRLLCRQHVFLSFRLLWQCSYYAIFYYDKLSEYYINLYLKQLI